MGKVRWEDGPCKDPLHPRGEQQEQPPVQQQLPIIINQGEQPATNDDIMKVAGSFMAGFGLFKLGKGFIKSMSPKIPE